MEDEGWFVDVESGGSGGEAEEVYCVCRSPYDASQFYVGCEACDGWFHPACVGITQTDAENMSEYRCPDCSSSAQSRPPSQALSSKLAP